MMKIFTKLILSFTAALGLGIIVTFFLPNDVLANHDVCPDDGTWGINTGGSSNPAGLVVKTVDEAGNPINGITFNLNANAHSVVESDADGGIHQFVSARTFTTGETIFCGPVQRDNYSGITVFGFGSTGKNGNHWVLWCTQLNSVGGDSGVPTTFWINNVAAPGGAAGFWTGNVGGWDTGFGVPNGGTPRITLTWHNANQATFGYLDGPHGIIDCAAIANAWGWAYDPDSSATSIEVHIYVDGPAGSGAPGFAILANQPRSDVNAVIGIPGDHGFVWTLPESVKDGSPHSLWVYGIDLTDPTGAHSSLLNNSPNLFSCLPPSCTLTLQPIAIERGETALLSWITTGAVSATILTEAGSFAASVPTGSRTVSPTNTFTYTLTIANSRGVTSDCKVTLLVAEPLTCSLAAQPQLFPAGTTSVLSWTTTGANSASIDQGIGAVELPTGTRNITPLATTTYTMTAQSPIGRTTTCFVIAHVLPSCTLSLLPIAIQPGGTALLEWTTVNATSASIEPGIGDVSAQLPFGKRSVSATVDTTFRMTVVNNEGTHFCEVTLHMLPTCTLDASPKAIVRGQSSTLFWTTTNTTNAKIDDGGTNVWDVSHLLPQGSMSVSPRVNTTYTMTAQNPWGSSTCFAEVTMLFSPLISPAKGTICDFTVLLLRVLGVSAFTIALFIFIFSGIRWIISRGDEKALASARSMILSTGIGLTIILAAVSVIFLLEQFFQITILKCPIF